MRAHMRSWKRCSYTCCSVHKSIVYTPYHGMHAYIARSQCHMWMCNRSAVHAKPRVQRKNRNITTFITSSRPARNPDDQPANERQRTDQSINLYSLLVPLIPPERIRDESEKLCAPNTTLDDQLIDKRSHFIAHNYRLHEIDGMSRFDFLRSKHTKPNVCTNTRSNAMLLLQMRTNKCTVRANALGARAENNC